MTHLKKGSFIGTASMLSSVIRQKWEGLKPTPTRIKLFSDVGDGLRPSRKIAISRQLLRLVFLLIGLLLLVMPVIAQGSDEVYVTTQDYVVLRLGPGLNWERLMVLDFGLTLRATGRDVRSDWIQVAYEGDLPAEASSDGTIDGITYGWVSSRYLIWTGNLLLLPVDGVQTVPTARRAGPQLLLVPDTVYYAELGNFANVAGIIRRPQFVELTGRIGSTDNGYFWMQFQLDGAYYWTATWYSDPPDNYRGVLDASYLFPFGRVFNAMLRVYNDSRRKLSNMNRRWNDLDAGFAATCNRIPAAIVFPDVLVTGIDVEREPVFNAPLNALILARDNINIAISQFEEVCNRDELSRFATPNDIDIGQAALQEARLQLNILNILLDPIGTQHPIANNE